MVSALRALRLSGRFNVIRATRWATVKSIVSVDLSHLFSVILLSRLRRLAGRWLSGEAGYVLGPPECIPTREISRQPGRRTIVRPTVKWCRGALQHVDAVPVLLTTAHEQPL